MVEVAKVLHKVVPSCESLLAHSRAVLDRAGEVGCAHSVDRRLVSLEICEPCKVGVRRAVRNIALPDSANPVSVTH